MAADSMTDWRSRKAIVFESDDWGDCTGTPDLETYERVRRHPRVQQLITERPRSGLGTLEDRPQLEALFEVLERHHGGDGRAAVFTAFYVTHNPDYDAIRASDFTEYHDIPIDVGWPPGWRSEGAIAGAGDGMRRGVWFPEFHARLHHSSPHLWLEILRGGDEDTDVYRTLFDNHIYFFDRHLPEYERMPIAEQFAWLRGGVDAFKRALGVAPHCGVNSDAIPGTEESYALLGIRVRCLKSVVLNNGTQVRPYGKLKPDGTMDGTTPMGAYNPFLDLTYLNRNAFFEVGGADRSVLDDAYQAIVNCWQRGEPAVVSTHRSGYCSLDDDASQRGRDLLDDLLARFETEHPDAVYMTSWEVAQLCRTATSAARYGDQWVLRNYGSDAATVAVPEPVGASAVDLRTGDRFGPPGPEPGVYRLPPGDYSVG